MLNSQPSRAGPSSVARTRTWCRAPARGPFLLYESVPLPGSLTLAAEAAHASGSTIPPPPPPPPPRLASQKVTALELVCIWFTERVYADVRLSGWCRGEGSEGGLLAGWLAGWLAGQAADGSNGGGGARGYCRSAAFTVLFRPNDIAHSRRRSACQSAVRAGAWIRIKNWKI